MKNKALYFITSLLGSVLTLIVTFVATLVSIFAFEQQILSSLEISQSLTLTIIAFIIAFLITSVTYYFTSQLRNTLAYFGHLDFIPFPLIVMEPPKNFINQISILGKGKSKIRFVNQAWEKHYNRSREFVVGKNLDFVRDIKPEIVETPKGKQVDEFFAELKSDWDRCFEELCKGKLKSSTSIPIPMLLKHLGEKDSEEYKFHYCAYRIDHKIRTIMVLTIPNGCNPPSLIHS